MKISTAVSVGLALAGITTSAPLTARTTKTAAQIILEIATTSGTCLSSNKECHTNMQVGPLMAKAAAQYKVDHASPIAAVLALTAFESADYAYNTNQQLTAGQGTSNMQMYTYNLKYAQSIPALSDPLNKLGTPDALLAASTANPPNAALMNSVRDLVTTDDYNFGSGFWFLTTQCGSDVIQKLKDNPDAGFAAYMGCVGVTINDKRQDYWTKAKQAFGL
ncbi:hypothetical protein F4680DRAFT_417507 [Xylaria scruposa]|nr:hypothetical protein F4680DRAFT_417507 [Xylaria scruposa]